MELSDLARAILFGSTLQDKLLRPDGGAGALSDRHRGATVETPRFPGRPPELARVGRAEFPASAELALDSARGRILHFFANHELLAMEIMALVLLRFPDAPEAFRLGVARTIFEEQDHMRLYLERMHELGVGFGELPVSDYFWRRLREMRTPMDFVTQMSLTFEQANLDFSRHYRDELARHGDEKTAAILDRVYREEIGHVKHGLGWFNRWRDRSGEISDWDAYRELLPPPMTPVRAKGLGHYCADARREAGLSEVFIRELEVCTGSKGRPPVVWQYNPTCEAEVARGKPGLSLPKTAARVVQDLECMPMYLADSQDLVLVSRRPRSSWLGLMQSHGFSTPEFEEAALSDKRYSQWRFGGFEPWGWSPGSFELFHPFRERLCEPDGTNALWAGSLLERESFEATGIGTLYSKAWSVSFLRDWLATHPEDAAWFGGLEHVGKAHSSADDALEAMRGLVSAGKAAMLKAPFGTSGAQVRRVRSTDEISAQLIGWMRNTIDTQGSLVVEPWLEKLYDLSIQLEVTAGSVRLLGARRFLTDEQFQYRGTMLGRKLVSLTPEAQRFFGQALPHWQRLATELGNRLRAQGYQGPAGIDALIWRTPEGELRLKPVVEVNPRWTMGRVALALEEHLAADTPGAWLYFQLRKDDIRPRLAELAPRFEEGRLVDGALATNDPDTAQERLTVLVAGRALSELT